MSSVACSVEKHRQRSLKRTLEVFQSAQRYGAQAYSYHPISCKKQKKKKKSLMPEILTEHILLTDVNAILKKNEAESSNESPALSTQLLLPEPFTEIEVEVTELSSTGDGLAKSNDGSNRVYVVPFTIPGDTVRVKVIRHVRGSDYTSTDLIRVLKPSPDRDDSLIRCHYFASCSGCQFQMLPYTMQLLEKKRVIEKAYRNFSGLPLHAVPKIDPTYPSPLQYGYRTKLTPHFDGPPGMRRKKRNGERPSFEEIPPIGFTAKNRRKILDIEDCPIGTDAIRLGINQERKRVTQDIAKYRSGATILLRQTTKRLPKPFDDSVIQRAIEEDTSFSKLGVVSVVEDKQILIPQHTYTTDHKSSVTEYVGEYVFSSPANAFFQNNNSILPAVTSYIRSRILGYASSTNNPCDSEDRTSINTANSPIVNLVDAYCGSGLFTITLSPVFKRSIGIDITASSIESARHNLRLNKIPPHRASFISADASNIFNELTLSSTFSSSSPSSPSLPSSQSRPGPPQSSSLESPPASAPAPASPGTYKFEPDETAVVIDPPRKGCDIPFLRQLIDFAPARIVYMSCNVHTQARDVGLLVGGLGTEYDEAEGEKAVDADSDSKPDCESRAEKKHTEGLYSIESIKGFDFFPQTSHVEVVTILQKKKKTM